MFVATPVMFVATAVSLLGPEL